MTDFTDIGVSHELKLQSTNITTLSDADMVRKIWWFDNGMWAPYGLDRSGAYAMFRAGTDQSPGAYLNLFEIISSSSGAPLLATDQGFVVQKDITAGGFVGSNQGELWLGSGRDDQVDVPKIILVNSAVSRLQGGGPLNVPAVPADIQFPTGENGKVAVRTDSWNGNPANTLYKHNGSDWIPMGPTSSYGGYFDTLYLTKAGGTDPAHLDVGNLTIHGNITVVGSILNLATQVASLIDSSLHFVGGFLGLNPTSSPTFAGLSVNGGLTINAPSQTGITLGNGTIYWQTATNPHVLEMNCGLIIDGALNVSGISINGSLGITSTSLVSNLNADMLDGHHANEFLTSQWNGGAISVGISSSVATQTYPDRQYYAVIYWNNGWFFNTPLQSYGPFTWNFCSNGVNLMSLDGAGKLTVSGSSDGAIIINGIGNAYLTCNSANTSLTGVQFSSGGTPYWEIWKDTTNGAISGIANSLFVYDQVNSKILLTISPNTGTLTLAGYESFSKTSTAYPALNAIVAGTVMNFQGGNYVYQLGIDPTGRLWETAYNGFSWYNDNLATLTELMYLDNSGDLTLASALIMGSANVYCGGTNLLKTDDAFMCVGDLTSYGDVYCSGKYHVGSRNYIQWGTDTYLSNTAGNVLQINNGSGGLGVLDVGGLYATWLVGTNGGNYAGNGGIYFLSDIIVGGSWLPGTPGGGTAARNIYPYAGNVGNCGTDTYYWGGMYANYIMPGTGASAKQIGNYANQWEYVCTRNVYVGGRLLYDDNTYLRTSGAFCADTTVTSGSCSGSGTRQLYANSNGTLTTSSSSIRYKENIRDLSDCSWIYALRPVMFDWKDHRDPNNQIGLIAEEVYAVNPVLAFTDKNGIPEGVHYERLGIPLLVAMQKHGKRIGELEAQVQDLLSQIEALNMKGGVN